MNNHFASKKRNARKGFSLVELVVVILIIAILAVAVFAGGSAVIKKSQVSRTTSDLHNFSVAVEAVLNENPGVANISTDSAANREITAIMDKLNANLPEDYKLTKIAAAQATGNITYDYTGTDGGTYIIAQSAKTDSWDNPYYVVFDATDRNPNGKSDFFITVVSAGPDAKTDVDGVIGGTNTLASGKADDVFLLVQYTDGDVTAVTYNCASDADKILNGEATRAAATTYQDTGAGTPAVNTTSPVNF